MLKVYLFGSPRLEQDEQALSLYRRRRSVALLAYMAQSPRLHSREKLVTIFWPEEAPTRARANLRRDLFHIRQHLKDELLTVSRTQVGFQPEAPLWVDTLAFQAKLHTVRAHRHEAGLLCATCLNALTEAVALYQEDFLTGFSLPDAPEFDEWCFFQGESLRHSLVEALQQLVAWHEQQQEYVLALPYAQRWLSLDALNEAVQRLLMRLYAQSGQQAAALRQYEKCAELLAKELGVEPEAETVTLYETIQARQYPKPAAGGVGMPMTDPFVVGLATAESFPAASLAPFVAREAELEHLQLRLDEAINGRFQSIFLTGAAGLGKTALLQAFARHASTSYPTLTVASGSCNAYTGSGDPYLPFREILNFLTGDKQAATISGAMTPERWHQLLPLTVHAILQHGSDLLGTLLPARPFAQRITLLFPERPSWVQQLETAVQHTEQNRLQGGQQIQQAALLEQYARVIQTIAQQTPLLLLLDDVQWIDSNSAMLLHHLGRRLTGYPVLLVAAYRPSEVAIDHTDRPHPLRQIIHEFQRAFGEMQIDLSQAAGEAFVAALLAQEPHALTADFQTTLYQQTNGHPLFTLELLRDMQARGDLAKDEQGRWAAKSPIDWQRLPARVEGAIGERIRRLDGSQREILQMASVAGEQFSAELVAAALNLNGRFVQTQLSRELDKKHQLVQAVDVQQVGGVRLARYRFRHILIQRYLYDRLDEVEQVYQHEAVGDALAQLFANDTSPVAVELARHYATAVIPYKARRYLEQAGDQAKQAIAVDQAAHYYRSALTHTSADAVAETAVLQRKLAETLWMLGQVPEARQLFEAALAGATQLEDEASMGVIHRHLGRMNWELHDRAAALNHYERSLAFLEQFPNSVELAWTLSSISQSHMLAFDHEQAIAWGERALGLAEKIGAEAVKAHALISMGAAYTGKDQEQALQLLTEGLQLARKQRLPQDVGQAYNHLINVLFQADRNQEAMTVIDEAYAYAEQAQTRTFLHGAAIQRMSLAFYLGNWRVGLAQLDENKRWLAKEEAVALNPIAVGLVAAAVANDCGLPHMALDELAQIETLLAGLDEPARFLSAYRQYMCAYALLDDAEQVQLFIQRMIEISERPQVRLYRSSWCVTAIEWLIKREDEQSLDQAKRLLTIIEAIEGAAAERSVNHLEGTGLIALRERLFAEAAAAFRQVVEIRQRAGYQHGLMRAYFYLGEALAQLKQPDEMGAAYARAQQIGAKLAAELDAPEMQAAFLQTPLLKAIARRGQA